MALTVSGHSDVTQLRQATTNYIQSGIRAENFHNNFSTLAQTLYYLFLYDNISPTTDSRVSGDSC